MKLLRLMMILAAGCMLAGCMSETIQSEEPKAPLLMIAQNGDGDVTLEWESDADHSYTIFFQPKADADWIGLDNANRLPGSGGTMTVYHHVNPNRPAGRYRLVEEKKD
jgi:hypothetical protein